MTCDISPLEIMQRNLSTYMAIAAAAQQAAGNHELSEKLYDASRAYELMRRNTQQ